MVGERTIPLSRFAVAVRVVIGRSRSKHLQTGRMTIDYIGPADRSSPSLIACRMCCAERSRPPAFAASTF